VRRRTLLSALRLGVGSKSTAPQFREPAAERIQRLAHQFADIFEPILGPLWNTMIAS
jgi:hypothetical protein